MTPEYILRKSLCREAHCSNESIERRADHIEEMTYTKEYAEPGYSNPEKCILFANWNAFPRGVDSLLEQYGYAIEWQDEWSTCEECGRAVRTEANGYDWQPSYALVNECEIICTDCIVKDAESYLEGLEDNPRTALNISRIDPANYDYTQLQDKFESGLHPGMTDNPTKIFAELQAQGKTRILFRIDEVSQFYITFSVWQKDEES